MYVYVCVYTYVYVYIRMYICIFCLLFTLSIILYFFQFGDARAQLCLIFCSINYSVHPYLFKLTR